MGDADLQAAMTGLQEVLPVLEQAQHLLREAGGQGKGLEGKGWSSTWSDRSKARLPRLVVLHQGFGSTSVLLITGLGPDNCSQH